MAAFTGILALAPHRGDDTLRCSASITAMEVTNPDLLEPPGMVSTPGNTPTYSNNQPVGELEIARTGGKVNSFLDDYYYRVHLDPYTLNLGAIVSPRQEEVLVWNAWFATKLCSAINEVNPEEYTLTGSSAPFSLAGLEWEIFTLDVPTTGSLEFVSTIEWVFGAESPILTITGQRVKIFGWEPLVPMIETLDWHTNIMKARDGSEQRMSVRWAPRQHFKFNVFVKNEQEQAKMDAVLHRWHKKTWGLPMWTEWMLHTTAISVDDTVIYLDTSNADYRDDSSAIIWQGPNLYEAVKILTVASDRLNLEVPVRNNWTGNKWIMPLRIANMLTKIQRPAAPAGHGRLSCDFITSDTTRITSFSAPTTYQGLTVITVPSIEETEQQVQIDSDAQITDHNLNRFNFFSDSDFNIVVQNHTFRKDTMAACWEFREFLHSLYGRREPFWVISDREDIVQQGNIGAADTDFNVDNIGLTNQYGDNTMRTHLAFVFKDGSHIYRQITGFAETDSSTEIISIDSGLGVLVYPGDCEICFMDKCRLTKDEIDIEWEGANKLRCSLDVTKVTA